MQRRKFTKTAIQLSLLTMTGAISDGLPSYSKYYKLNDLVMQMTPSQIHTATFSSKGKEVKIHAVQTGWISVKENFLNRKGKGVISQLNILFGNQYADYMPIWAWIIEHPEGIIVIDTGDIEAADHPEFYKDENFGSKFNLRAMANRRRIMREEEIGNQLIRLHLKPEQVAKVILTHLHGDHTDGLMFFPTNEIIVIEDEFKHPYGNLPSTYPKWFKPTLVNFSKDRIDFFDRAYAITKAEDLWLIPTRGHTHHHVSVILVSDTEHVLIAGDASYSQQQLLQNTFAGANVDIRKSQETYDLVKEYARKYQTIYLPSHDHDSGTRLLNREFLHITNKT